jgi:putative flippase GtrA
MIRQFASRQFLLFIFTGGIAAMVNFGSRILYSLWVDFSSAIVFAYLTGMVTAYVLARIFVFKQTSLSLGRSALMFVLVNVVAVAQTWWISLLLADNFFPWMGMKTHVREFAHAVGVLVPVFTSYIGHKHFSFNKE